MKILYRQDEEDSLLGRYGIGSCYFKSQTDEKSFGGNAARPHYHRCFELHIVVRGHLIYEVNGKSLEFGDGTFLLISPRVRHTAVLRGEDTEKYAIHCDMDIIPGLDYFQGKLTDRMLDNIGFILSETALKRELSAPLIEGCIFETLVTVLRMLGKKEAVGADCLEENAVLKTAKQYIDDNIDEFPCVGDVAEYCCLGAKQLTRIFTRCEGTSPGAYIVKKRVERIEQYLIEGDCSLKEISERMSFSSEYYFNAFFKRYGGMPPGAYRKMMGK